MTELDDIYTFAIQLGKDAGAMLQTAANARIAGKARLKSVEKASAVDIVTETDESELNHECCAVPQQLLSCSQMSRLSSRRE
jgi:hypothetical protein